MTHWKAVDVTRRTAIGICVILMSLLLAGCSGDDEDRYGKPPSASPTQRTGSPSPTGPVSDEQAILAQYRKFWTESLPKAYSAVNSQRRAILESLVVDPALSRLLENMAAQDAAGKQAYGSDIPVGEKVEIINDLALVTGCLDSSNSGLADSATDRKLSRGPDRNPVLVNLRRVANGTWRVSFVKFSGGSKC